MKAKYFTKIRKQVKWYNVSYREHIFDDFSNEKNVLAKSPENACLRYHKRTGCFINSISGYVRQMPENISRFKVCIGKKVMCFD